MHFLIWRVNVCWSTSRKEQTVCSLTVIVCVCECHTQTERYSMFEYDINGTSVQLMQTAKTVYKTGPSSHLSVFAAVYWSRCFISVLPNQLDNQVCRNNSRWLQKVTRYRSLHLNLSQIIISYYERTTYVPGRFISHKHMLQSPSYVLNAHICEPHALEMHCMNNTYNIHSTIIYCLSVLKMRRMFNNS